MFYLQSQPKGFVDQYSLLIELPDLPRELNPVECIVSELEFNNENIDGANEFISYASAVKLTIAFPDIDLYPAVLLALYTSQECIVNKNGLLCFKGQIEDVDGIEYSVKDREITFSIVSYINKLKTIKVTDVIMENYGVQSVVNSWNGERWYKIKDVIRAYFIHIGYADYDIKFNHLENIKVREVRNGIIFTTFFSTCYFQFQFIVAINPDTTVWDMLKQIFNLFCIDCYVVGKEVIIQNKFLWKNSHIPAEQLNNRFSLSSSYRTRGGGKKVTVKIDGVPTTLGDPNANNELIIETRLASYTANQFNVHYTSFGVYCPAILGGDDNVWQAHQVNIINDLPEFFFLLDDTTSIVIYNNIMNAKFVIDTEFVGSFDITKFYLLNGKYYKVANYSFDVGDNKSKIVLVEVTPYEAR